MWRRHLLPENRVQVLCLRERLAFVLSRAALCQTSESNLRQLFFESTLPHYEKAQESVLPGFKNRDRSPQSWECPSDLNKAMLAADSLNDIDENITLIQETMMDFSEDDDEARDSSDDELDDLEDLSSDSNPEAVRYTEGWLRARRD